MARQAALAQFLRNTVLKDPRVTLDAQTPLVSSGLVDSLSLVKVLSFVEDAFGVVIPDEAATAESMNTIGQILQLVDAFDER